MVRKRPRIFLCTPTATNSASFVFQLIQRRTITDLKVGHDTIISQTPHKIFILPADCVFFGNPYDAATTYRMGARFGPAAVRKVSQTLAFNYSPYFEKDYSKMRIYDAGDSAGNPFNILTAMNQTYLYAKKLWNSSSRVIGIGGDHSLSWCILRAARDVTGGPVALVNLDAHFDTVDEYQGGRLT